MTTCFSHYVHVCVYIRKIVCRHAERHKQINQHLSCARMLSHIDVPFLTHQNFLRRNHGTADADESIALEVYGMLENWRE